MKQRSGSGIHKAVEVRPLASSLAAEPRVREPRCPDTALREGRIVAQPGPAPDLERWPRVGLGDGRHRLRDPPIPNGCGASMSSHSCDSTNQKSHAPRFRRRAYLPMDSAVAHLALWWPGRWSLAWRRAESRRSDSNAMWKRADARTGWFSANCESSERNAVVPTRHTMPWGAPTAFAAAFALICAATTVSCGSDDGLNSPHLDVGLDLREPSVQADAVPEDTLGGDSSDSPSTRSECGDFVLRTRADVQALAALQCERVQNLWFVRSQERPDNPFGSLASLNSIRTVDELLLLEGVSDAEVAEVARIGIETVEELHVRYTWDLERVDFGPLTVNQEIQIHSNPLLHTLGDTGQNLDFRGNRIILMNNLALPRCEVQQFVSSLTVGETGGDVEVIATGNTVRDRESCLAVDGNCDGTVDTAPDPCPDGEVCTWDRQHPSAPLTGEWHCVSQ